MISHSRSRLAGGIDDAVTCPTRGAESVSAKTAGVVPYCSSGFLRRSESS